MVLFRRVRWHNPFDYDLAPANQEELMTMIYPLEKVAKEPARGREGDVGVMWAKFKRDNNVYVWGFLALVGFAATLWLVSLDLTLRFGIFKARDMLLERYDYSLPMQYLAYVLWTIVLALASAIIVKGFCYPAAGSGIPDLKSMFSGFFKKETVAVRVLILKSIALLLSYGSGLSVGKEGPYVHLAACVANVLLCFKPFSTEVGSNETKRTMMLAACSALGIAATFGSPIGGVLFSIEVTSTYYLIHNYWRSFFASAVGAVTIKIVLSQQQVHLLESFRTNLPEIKNLASVKLIAFIFTGICCGLLASLFIWLYERVVTWKTRHATLLSRITPFGEVFCVALVTGIISFPLLFLRLDHGRAVHSLFTNDEIDLWYKQMFPGDIINPTHDSHVRGGIILATLIYTSVKLCLTAVSITLPIPYGIYIPLFAIGAAFGRSFGELFALIFPEQSMEPNGFAAIGAAAMCGGATRTISSAVIILELTNDLNYFVPVLLTVAISCGIGNVLNHSIYDVFLRNKGLPYLPFIRVKDIIPVVDNAQKLHLVGSITRPTLQRVLKYSTQIMNVQDIGAEELEIELAEITQDNAELIEEVERRDSYLSQHHPSNHNQEERQDDVIDLFDMSLRNPWVVIDAAPFQVVESTPVRKVLFMFTMLGGNMLFVTYRGKLVGTLTKQTLVQKLSPTP